MFSKTEEIIILILKDKKMTITEVSEQFFNSKLITIRERNIVACVIRRIVAKCVRHNLNWTINGKGGGRAGRIVWRAIRKKDTIKQQRAEVCPK